MSKTEMPPNSRWRGAALSMAVLALGTCTYGYLQNARIEALHAQLAAADAQGRTLRSQLSAQQHSPGQSDPLFAAQQATQGPAATPHGAP